MQHFSLENVFFIHKLYFSSFLHVVEYGDDFFGTWGFHDSEYENDYFSKLNIDYRHIAKKLAS